MQNQSNPVNWFEISVNNLERAKKFYGAVLETEFQDLDLDNTKMALFAMSPEKPGTGGSLLLADEANPSADGTTIYFSCEDCAVEVGRVEANGGSIVFPKMSIGEFGFVAQFMDTEGNRIGLHSQK
ncbi:MAG: VOC family protein [Cyclobacteriaceae bacterium]|nr:VOC family protein [Cyclobacteriaceae bacterium]